MKDTQCKGVELADKLMQRLRWHDFKDMTIEEVWNFRNQMAKYLDLEKGI